MNAATSRAVALNVRVAVGQVAALMERCQPALSMRGQRSLKVVTHPGRRQGRHVLPLEGGH
jgi:hypothetical protein